MKFKSFVCLLMAAGMMSCVGNLGKNVEADNVAVERDLWENFFVGHIHFNDEAPETEGSKIYHSVITDPNSYISEQARKCLSLKKVDCF